MLFPGNKKHFPDANLYAHEIDETVERIMSAPISAKAKERIKASVLAGNTPSYYTQLYQSHMSKQTEETRSILSNRLENLFGALFQMGEIHLF